MKDWSRSAWSVLCIVAACWYVMWSVCSSLTVLPTVFPRIAEDMIYVHSDGIWQSQRRHLPVIVSFYCCAETMIAAVGQLWILLEVQESSKAKAKPVAGSPKISWGLVQNSIPGFPAQVGSSIIFSLSCMFFISFFAPLAIIFHCKSA